MYEIDLSKLLLYDIVAALAFQRRAGVRLAESLVMFTPRKQAPASVGSPGLYGILKNSLSKARVVSNINPYTACPSITCPP